jgi:predicted ATP-dependent endonuclease of OLD family
MNEGFFADVVVLVEGEDDRAAIMGVAAARGHDFDAKGIAVIPCGGKCNIDRPALIFSSFEIPVYAVWDSDQGKSDGEETNRRLLRLMGVQEEAWPSAVTPRYACFKNNLEATLREELGPERFLTFMGRAREAMGIRASQAVKTPAVFSELIRTASQEGQNSPTLDGIVVNILSLLPIAGHD